jgi:ribosomal protein S18 acetylase RimI-like enzyme
MIQIVTATDADDATINAFANKVLEHHQTFDSFYQPVAPGSAPVTPEKVVFIAKSDEGQIVGYIKGVWIEVPVDRSYSYAVIQSIWVEEASRGQGVAKQLITTFEGAMKEKGVRQIDLFVDVRNELGQALWNGAGYTTYQEKRRKFL